MYVFLMVLVRCTLMYGIITEFVAGAVSKLFPFSQGGNEAAGFSLGV